MANRGRPKITTGIPRSEAERKALEEWKKIFSVKTIKLSANSIFKPDHAEQLINIFLEDATMQPELHISDHCMRCMW